MPREQTILDAMVTAVTGLATTGSNVFAQRAYPVAADKVPAITVRMGPSVPTDEDGYQNIAYVDQIFIVYTRIHVKATEAQLDNQVLDIWREMWQSIMADRTLGLSYVHDVQPGGREEPALDDQAEKPTLLCDVEWRVLYRHSLTDPGA